MDKKVAERNARWAMYIWIIVTAVMVVHVFTVVSAAAANPENTLNLWVLGGSTALFHILPEAVSLTAWLLFRRKAK
ncbi:MAG: hypothetical protein PHD32_04350 [Eubacteriales bacterium]|nr:hypothetical protein [Eubacteriales bacterium]